MVMVIHRLSVRVSRRLSEQPVAGAYVSFSTFLNSPPNINFISFFFLFYFLSFFFKIWLLFFLVSITYSQCVVYIFQGYCVDLAELLQQTCDTPYEYRIDLVGDGNYGSLHEDLGCWDGMIGELISTQGCPSGTRKVRTVKPVTDHLCEIYTY